MRRSKKTSKLRANGLCAENSPVTDEFSSQMASNGENVSIWWRHHGPYAVLVYDQHIYTISNEMAPGTVKNI